MTQRHFVPNQGTRTMAPAVAPPVLSLAPDLLQEFDMSNGPELFLMDDAEFVQQDCHINTFATLEVDIAQAQTCGCACAQFTKIEAGSAYRSLAGQLAIPFAETPVRSLPLETTYRTDPSATTTSLLDVLPAATLPRDIASPVETPSIAISHWPQRVSFPEQAYYSNELYDSPDLKFDDLLNTPSNSFQSTTSSWMTRTEAQRFHDLSFADEDLLSPTTAPSSFDLGSVNPSNSASFPSEAQGFQYLGCLEDDLPTSFTAPFSFNTLPTQPPNPPSFPSPSRFLPLDPSNHLSQPLTQPTTPLQPADLSMETWARGTYNVSDRTNYGSLAPPNPTRRKRKPPSLASLTTPPNKCPTCTKTFPSRSERDHHARWHGPKTHMCSFPSCGKGFIASKDLKRHERIHKPHAFFCDEDGCVFGSRGFAREDHLVRHRRIHGGGGGVEEGRRGHLGERYAASC